jgi:hypothetical protein
MTTLRFLTTAVAVNLGLFAGAALVLYALLYSFWIRGQDLGVRESRKEKLDIALAIVLLLAIIFTYLARPRK